MGNRSAAADRRRRLSRGRACSFSARSRRAASRARLRVPQPIKGGVSAEVPTTLAIDDLEEPDPPVDTRPLSLAIAIVRVRTGGALHRVRFRHSSPRVPESKGIRGYPQTCTRIGALDTSHECPAKPHVLTSDPRGEHRTQEVAGSSPASSIRSRCKRRCLRAAAAVLRLAAFG